MNSIMLSLSCEALLAYNNKRQLLFKKQFLVSKAEDYKQHMYLIYNAVLWRTALFFYSTHFFELFAYIPINNKFLNESLFATVRISFFYVIKRQKLQFYKIRAPPTNLNLKNSDWRK